VVRHYRRRRTAVGWLWHDWFGCVQPHECLAKTRSARLSYEDQGFHCFTVRAEHLCDERNEPLVHWRSGWHSHERQFVRCVSRRMGLASLIDGSVRQASDEFRSCCSMLFMICHYLVRVRTGFKSTRACSVLPPRSHRLHVHRRAPARTQSRH
jgi:hypothetical protein